jgi:multidrug efflux pump subunit AcrB
MKIMLKASINNIDLNHITTANSKLHSGKSGFPSFTIIIIFILLILCGIPIINFLNLELNPNASSSSISVRFSWNGAEPRIIEQEATSKLEALLAGVNGIRDISSTSGNGTGNINLTLDKNADADAVRFEISTLIRQVWPEMPTGAAFPTLYVNSTGQESRRPLLTYKLTAPQSHPIIKQYADDHIRPALSLIQGINKIEINGASPLEWRIEYDEKKLKSTGITQSDIQIAVARGLAQENIGVGLLPVSKRKNEDQPGYKAPIPVTLQTCFLKGTDILNIPVKKTGNRIVFLSDIATLNHVEGQPQNYYRINGLNTINILVYPAPGENNLVVGKKVKEIVNQISYSLPPSYEMLLSDDSTEYINRELHNIALRSMCTFFILLIFMLVVTRKIKHALLILIMLVGNLSIAVIFYYLFKLEIHLYALAGITVSLGLMTDNIIIMSDHLRTRGNRKAFLAIFAGTLSTVSSLVAIFFLKEQFKANLVDFALVIIINQSVSLLTALFVIPALMEKLELDKYNHQLKPRSSAIKTSSHHDIMKSSNPYKARLNHRLGYIIRFTNLYRNLFLFIRNRRVIAIVIFVLGFGLPLYMLPDKWEGEKWYNKAYNAALGSNWYKENLKTWVDKISGGALRLFTEKVFSGSYFRNPQETTLYITATMLRGTTLQQANDIVSGMEEYLKQFSEIKLFQTNISSRSAYISVYFKKKYQLSGFPYTLKEEMISRTFNLGGAGWSVYGFGDGFSNRIIETAGFRSISMLGYNYDVLTHMAEVLRDSLMKNPRVKQVFILSEHTFYKPDNTEFVVHVDNEHAITTGIAPTNLYSSLQNWSLSQPAFAGTVTGRGLENIRLIPQDGNESDIWSLSQRPLNHDSVMYKFNVFSTIGKEATTPVISKINQQYQIYLQFDYIGSNLFARRYIDEKITNFLPLVPLGYTVSSGDDGFYSWDKKQYWLLFLIALMIFFICAVLFESLLQPFAVILTIPVAYIGIFLTFFLFGLNFDQGGFAALVMLSGITVNAAIYIINDFNNLRRQKKGRNLSVIKLYFKAFNYKIIPILLTVASTILGFIPFLIGEKQPFWFALAAGTIGGLLFSLLGIVFYLPLFLRIKELRN